MRKLERWKSIAGYEGFYEVSDRGRVRSLDRTVYFADGRVRFYRGRMCRLKRNEYGYPLALLSQGMERKCWYLVHRLVLEAFVGPCPAGKESCHNNGVRHDARLCNLRYDTRRANHADKRRHGTLPQGATHYSAVYPDAVIAAVRGAQGTITEIAAAHVMSRTHAWNIRNSKRRGTS